MDAGARIDQANWPTRAPRPAAKLRALKPRSGRPVWAALGSLAVAAALAVVARPDLIAPAPLDGLRSKGSPLEVEAYAYDGRSVWPVRSGGTVHVGERIGFRVWLGQPGELMVVGADQQDHAYLVYPYAEAARSRSHAASLVPETLADAVEMDELEGMERLVTLHCPGAFSFEEVKGRLLELTRTTPAETDLAVLKAGCIQRETRLNKVKAGTAPQKGIP